LAQILRTLKKEGKKKRQGETLTPYDPIPYKLMYHYSLLRKSETWDIEYEDRNGREKEKSRV